MPIFEYICGDCDHQFETLVQGSAPPECPSCHGTRLAKQFSVFAVSVKGSASRQPSVPGPCGSCGHPDGPGACSLN